MKNGETINKVEWEDIESSYFIYGVGHFVCPKGSFFLYQYNNHNLFEKKPSGFENVTKDWELICFYHFIKKKWMFQGFLNSNSIIKLYGINLNEYQQDNWINISIDDGIYDFLWDTNLFYDSDEQKHNMFALTLSGGNIFLNNLLIQIYSGGLNAPSQNKTLIAYKSQYMHAYFDHNTKQFYWMVSNGTNNFSCGYSIEQIDLKRSNVGISKIIHSTSPFLFLNKMKIEKLNMIRNSRFVIYEILDEIKNIKYRGIIDIELNQIIFNTNESFNKFQPLMNYSIFALTDIKAYEICLIKDSGKCVERCPSGKRFVLNHIKGNYCGDTTCQNFILKPNDICSDFCNITYYSIINNNECGFCKDIDSKNPYKIMNQEGCVNYIPENTYVFNEKFKLLNYCSENCISCNNSEKCNKCAKGYTLENNSCRKINNSDCYKNCQECNYIYIDENNQYCTKCKNNYKFYDKNGEGEGNCLDECPDNFFNNNGTCSKCHDNCQTCLKGPEILNGTENENCDLCKNNSKFLVDAEDYFKNCVDECPNGTNISYDDNKCKIIKNNEKDKKEKDSLINYIYIIFIGICLLILTIYIYKNICMHKKKDNELVTQIHAELQENKLLE